MLSKSQVKYIQSLGQKKGRDSEGLFIAEGPKIISELLSNPAVKFRQLFAVPEWIDENKTNDVEGIEVSEDELAKISQLQTANQVLGVLEQFPSISELPAKGTITLVLDTIQDPGNLGTIIRIADWFGVKQIVCSPASADIYNPKVVQSTMGSIARVSVLYAELENWISGEAGVPCYATDLEGEDITSMNAIREGIIIIGNESRGISAGVLAKANTRITIPRIGAAESLNASVATGIILSHLLQK